MTLPFSQACENNKQPILDVLHPLLADSKRVLEVGSGTGQHAVHFAPALPWLEWQPSDLAEHHPGIEAWRQAHSSDNLHSPILFDLRHSDWPGDFDRLAADIDAIMPRMASGTARFSPTANTTYHVPIEFPEGLFTATLVMAVSAHSSAPNVARTTGATAITSSGADLLLYRTNSNPSALHWWAIQLDGGATHHGWERPQYDGSSGTLARPTRYLNSLQAAVRAGLVRIDAGNENIPASSNAVTSKNVTFKQGLFTRTPVVLTGMFTSSAVGDTYLGTSSSGTTAQGTTLYSHRTSNNSTDVFWVAIQPTIDERLWTPGGPADLPGIFREFAENTENLAPRIDIGTVDVFGIGDEHIEFQPGLFTRPPVVLTTIWSAAAGRTITGVAASQVTATGAQIYSHRTSDHNNTVLWIAVQI